MKRDWYVYGEDKYGRRRPMAGGGFTERAAITWAQAAAQRDARTMGFVRVVAIRCASQCHTFPVAN